MNLPQLPYFATSSESGQLNLLKGSWLVLYFYPKDSTPGCTTEGLDFKENYSQFVQADCRVYGISRDTLKSHETFKAKQGFPFELISDTDESLCNAFSVIKMKNMYGKQVRGIERSTFLFNPLGELVKEWRKVNVNSHVEEVLTTLKSLQN